MRSIVVFAGLASLGCGRLGYHSGGQQDGGMDASARDAGRLDAVTTAPDSPFPFDAPLPDAPFPFDAPLLDAPFFFDAPLPDAPFRLDPDAPFPFDAPFDAPLPDVRIPLDAPRRGPCGGGDHLGWEANGNFEEASRRIDLVPRGAVTFDTGHRGEAWVLDGTGFLEGAYVAGGSLSELVGDITVEAWVLAEAPVTSARIVDRITPGVHDGLLLDVETMQPRWIAVVGTISAAPLPVGSWVHLAGTREGDVTRLYVNGALVDEQTTAGALGDNLRPLRIGADQDGTRGFVGRIDEVRIYCRALRASEVLSRAML